MAIAVPGKRAALIVFLAVYFAYFSRNALTVHFAPDDMMNMDSYWRMRPLQLLLAQVMPWRPFYRPLGGLFYRCLFAGFGLNPAPYHVVLLLILFVNVCLCYSLAVVAGGGEIAAALAAIAVCYHAGINNLYYNTAFTYDALCCCFYLAALVLYLRVRQQGRVPGAGVAAAVLLLYLCALNSKEMAVTLPAMLLAYEWLYHRSRLGVREWLRGAGRLPLLAAGVTLVYCYGRVAGAGGLMHNAAYRPVLSWHQVVDFQIRSWTELLIRPSRLEFWDVVAIWVVLSYLAWRRDRPVLRLCWWLLVIAPLPIEVLQGRGGACLAIPFVGLAIFASVVFADLCRAAAGFFAGEPGFRWLGSTALFAAALGLGAAEWAWFNADLQQRYVRNSMAQLGQPTWDVIQQLRALHPKVSRNAEIVFLHDPFDGFDMEFIAELWFRDHSLIVRVPSKVPVSPEDFARAERVFDFRDGKLVQLR